MQKSVLWAEDLEGHRQPSLYYLSGEEGADGPHLICDWNGNPTDFSEMDFDSLTIFKEHDEPADSGFDQKDQHDDEETTSDDDFVDFPNPAADILKLTLSGEPQPPTHRQNDLDFAECAHLDFLSVPPMTGGLLKRFVRNLLLLKSKYPTPKPEKDALWNKYYIKEHVKQRLNMYTIPDQMLELLPNATHTHACNFIPGCSEKHIQAGRHSLNASMYWVDCIRLFVVYENVE